LKTISIAKITRPKLSGALERARLFDLLDRGKQKPVKKPVIWIAAQAGSGKTTLVASWLDARKLPCLWYQLDEGDADIASFFYYLGVAAKSAAPRYNKSLPILTPEYHQGIQIFTRRYFEELFRRFSFPTMTKGRKKGFVIVLDNYQDVPLTSGFHDMIVHGLDAIPDGITLVILSRTPPPPKLARLQANNRLHAIGWEDVRFTREESLGLLDTQGHGKTTPDALTMLHNKADGWAAGLILLAGMGTSTSTSAQFASLTSEKLFDYFANEIFNKTDSSIQDVLLKTSFLQKIDSEMAEQLTGNAMAGQLLDRMSLNQYFTRKYGQAYQYHPLFREFLQSRAQTHFSAVGIADLQQKAAGLLEQSGNEEEAVALYIKAADWGATERIVLKQAPVLVSQGRSHTLAGWLHSLPPDHLDNSPWALYWLGICRIAYQPTEARGYLEQAFLHFKKEKNVSGVFLAWASIVETFIYECSDLHPLGHWVKVAEDLIAEYPEFPSPEIEARVVGGMLGALTWRQTGHPDASKWADKAIQIALYHPGVELRLMMGRHLAHYYIFNGEFAQATLLMEVLKPFINSKENSPLTQQSWFVIETCCAWFMLADNKTCVQMVTRGLEHAQEHGIHLLDLLLLGQGASSGVALGDPVFARKCLEQMAEINSPRRFDQAYFHFLSASVAWYLGDLRKSIEHGKIALHITRLTGCIMPYATCLLEQALTLFDDGQHEEAKRCLEKHDELAHGMIFVNYARLLYGARFAFELGEEEQGLALLRQGLAIGARHGYVNMHRWHNRTMSRLCAKALKHDIETAYVQKLIRTRHLVPEGTVENWPYPIRIYTLGRFQLLKDGKPVLFSGKMQKKPIELLKALIALGGQEVPVGRLVDALWPDSDGDAGHGTLKSTIFRLRQLLGSDEAVLVSGGAVCLDSRLCYVDAFDFYKLMKAAEMALPNTQQTNRNSQPEIALKVLDLYQGRFLPADTACVWSISLRERLQHKFIRFILQDGKALEEKGRWSEAIDRYHRVLEVDDLHEEIYQRLMYCHLQLGQQAEVVYIYQRCKQTLLQKLGIFLSDQTEALHKSAMKRTA